MQVHKIIFEEVQKIVNEHDPIGLVSGGAPKDEYHTEVGKIVALLRNESRVGSLTKKIEDIFLESFEDTEHSKSIYPILSEKLIELKKRLRW
jgi:hypothetical protein